MTIHCDRVLYFEVMHKKLIVANWKSHKTLSEATEWLKLFKAGIADKDLSQLRIGIAPSFPYLELAKNALIELPNCFVVAQDISQFPHGKYTGAVNGAQLKSVGVTHVLIGHSERRRYFGETHQLVAQKIEQAVDNDLQPIVCVTEDQIEQQADALDKALKSKCIVAYEPLSAIGTGMGEDVPAVRATTAKIKEHFGAIQILYGGSVSPHNIIEYLMVTDGVLVGTASLDVQEFLNLIHKSQE